MSSIIDDFERSLAYTARMTAWKQRRAKIQEMRQAGMTLQAIALHFGVTAERVRQITEKLPADVQQGIYNLVNFSRRTIDRIEARGRAEAGQTVKEAARAMGVHSGSLTDIAHQEGFRFKHGNSVPKHSRDLAVILFMKGYRPDEIAVETGYKTGASVTQALWRLGITVASRAAKQQEAQ